ncbi:hypothetical protein F5Y10DRAFT_258046 [Nemania abortiva]|nr:hypothetical protein F5Y10DRAFT_258046 [Nemania abortiva]
MYGTEFRPGKDALPIRTRPTQRALSNQSANIRRDTSSLRKAIAHGKVSKHSLPQKPPPTAYLPRHRIKTVVRMLPVLPHHYDRAVSWFSKLRTLPLSGCVHRIQSQEVRVADPDRIALEHPEDCYRLLLDRMPSRWESGMTRRDLGTLRRILTHDIAVLYDAHVPYKLEIWRLFTARIKSRSMQSYVYKPWINTFDYDIDPQDEDIQWADLKESVMKSANAQFDVLEALVELVTHPRTELRAHLEPNAVMDLLRVTRLGYRDENLVTRGVSTYSTKFGRSVVDKAANYLFTIIPRTAPQHIFETVDYYNTVAHVLQLADSTPATESVEPAQFLAIRALLLAVYAMLLVHLHAKTIANYHSANLVVLEEEDTADNYTGVEQFRLVADARQRLADAVDAVYAMDVNVGDAVRVFIQKPKGVSQLKVPLLLELYK